MKESKVGVSRRSHKRFTDGASRSDRTTTAEGMGAAQKENSLSELPREASCVPPEGSRQTVAMKAINGLVTLISDQSRSMG